MDDLEVVYAYLDALGLWVRSGGKLVRVPALAVVRVLADGQKVLGELDLCAGESHEAWNGRLDGLVARGLQAPLLCIIDDLRRDGTLDLPYAETRSLSTDIKILLATPAAVISGKGPVHAGRAAADTVGRLAVQIQLANLLFPVGPSPPPGLPVR